MRPNGATVPFRYQFSEADCVPTTFLNGIAVLFGRDEIPPLVIQRVYTYTLNGVSRTNTLGDGTDEWGIRVTSEWLGSYREGQFALKTEYLRGTEVHLRRGNQLVSCLNTGGVALCNVHVGRGLWHYVLAIKADPEGLSFFDPYYLRSVKGLAGAAQRMSDDDDGANLWVQRELLDTYSNKKRYCFGSLRNREAVLLWRRKR
ncbi:MAG: hypothetical protein ACR2LU_11975 [Luteitalea sp.]|nr:hypothetical protein [Acidobacteriota bacterium]